MVPPSLGTIRCAVRPAPPTIGLPSRTSAASQAAFSTKASARAIAWRSALLAARSRSRPVRLPSSLAALGVGVTPMLAMLHGAAATNAVVSRPVWWLHSARDRAHHSFAKEADDLLVALPASHRCVIYSRPAPGDRLGQDFDRPGHLTPQLLHELGIPQDADFYLCGPPRFLEDFQKGLAAWGIPWPRVHVELFGSAPALTPGISGVTATLPHRPDGPSGGGPIVTFLRSGLAVPWDSRFGSLLELAEACAVPVRWSCRSGICHNCESGLIGGELAYAPKPLDPPAEGNALICCATPKTAVELDL